MTIDIINWHVEKVRNSSHAVIMEILSKGLANMLFYISWPSY